RAGGSTHPTLHARVGSRASRWPGAVAGAEVVAGPAATCASATMRLSSGRHEPQLVPARSAAPMASTLVAAPDWKAARIVASPTPKQAQTVGPVLASPSADRPERMIRRASSASVSASNSGLIASHCGVAPMNGREQRAATLAVADGDLEHAGAEAGGDAREAAVHERHRLGVRGMHLDERLGEVRAEPRAQARARHGVPLVAHAAGIES